MAAPPQSSGQWRIEHRIDRATGEPSPTALLTTRATNTKIDFGRPVLLQLMCFEKKPIVRLAFEFRVGATRSASVAYRFDENPGHDVEAKFLPDYKTVVIDDKAAVARFMDEIANANVLFFRISSLFAGRTAAEFRVQGAVPAIEAVLATCPASTPPKSSGPRTS
jgi:hypothetical protein